MEISTVSHHLDTLRRAPAFAAKNPGPAKLFSSTLETATGKAPAVDQADFTRMTRQEMFNWMNAEIRSGRMSLDESSPFVGMTMKISVATGQPVDMATDATRINFIDKARAGIEGALSRKDQGLAERLQMAIDVMKQHQGQTIALNAQA